jgi:hypothetical protein
MPRNSRFHERCRVIPKLCTEGLTFWSAVYIIFLFMIRKKQGIKLIITLCYIYKHDFIWNWCTRNRKSCWNLLHNCILIQFSKIYFWNSYKFLFKRIRNKSSRKLFNHKWLRWVFNFQSQWVVACTCHDIHTSDLKIVNYLKCEEVYYFCVVEWK